MFKNLSVGLKIAFIGIVGFIGIIIFQSANYRLSVNLRDQLHKVFTEDFIILKFSNDIQINFSDLDKLYQAALIEADMDTLMEADIKAKAMKIQFESFQRKYHLDNPVYNDLVKLFNEYTRVTSSHTSTILTGHLGYQQALLGYDQIGVLRQRYEQSQSRFFEQCYAEFEKQLQLIKEEGRFLVEFGLVLGVLLTVILGTISFFVIKNLIHAFSNAVNVAQQIAGGDFDQEIVPRSTDETGKMMLSLKAMRDALKKQRDDNLRREHTRDFLGGLNETMRGDPQLDQLLQLVLVYLAQQFSANVGTFYIWQEGKLIVGATWGLEDGLDAYQGSFEKSYIGQVALSRNVRILNNLPRGEGVSRENLSAIGIKSLLLSPVFFESEPKGLIELGALRPFTQSDMLLMQRCNHAIAIAINSALSRLTVANMLQQTQEQAEILKNQRRALEISGRYKSQFLSTMSHELRTPLNSILILSESLMGNRHGALSSQEVQHAKVIHNAGTDLLTLINDILDLSKIEEGKMEIVWEKFNLRQMADNIFHAFDLQAKNQNLIYEVNVADDVPEMVYSDSLRLKQILKNFISNALKFTESGGVYVNFSVKKKADGSAKKLMICVEDTGLGIENAMQDNVFEAFKQLDGTTSRKYGGTGLGLSISRDLANLLNGEIGLYSEGSNKGSNFTLSIPMDTRQTGHALLLPHHGRTEPQKSNNGFNQDLVLSKVLIVEDNPVLIQTMKSIFKRNDVPAVIKATGADAIAAIKQQFFACLIMDLNLPDYDGVALLKEIRSVSDYRYTPLIVFTAEDLSIADKNSISRYADHIVQKTPSAIRDVCLLSKTILATQFNQDASHDEEMTNYDFAGKHLLLVDDDERNLYSLSIVLKNSGLDVTSARSGQEAIDMLASDDSIDLILLDIMMPLMDGYEVMRILKTHPLYASIPIIALTAKAMKGDKEKCLSAGASQYLSKPVEVQDLLYSIAIELT